MQATYTFTVLICYLDMTVTVMYIRDICDVVLFLTTSVVSALQCVYKQIYIGVNFT